jgi:hypothetical protein
MGRKRVVNLDDLFFDSRLCRLLKGTGLHVYERLWTLAEDWGGYEYDPEDISLQMGALREIEKITPQKVEEIINILIQEGKIITYDTGNGRQYHWIKNFMKHQPLKNPTPPKLPLPPWIQCEQNKYKSGKVYARYQIIEENLPGASQETTGSLPEDSQEAPERLPVGSKQKQKGNRKEKKGKDNKPSKKQFLDCVYLTEKEYDTLVERYGKHDTQLIIEKLNDYKMAHGATYKSDYHAMQSWVIEEVRGTKKPIPKQERPPAKCEKCGESGDMLEYSEEKKKWLCFACYTGKSKEEVEQRRKEVRKLISGVFGKETGNEKT